MVVMSGVQFAEYSENGIKKKVEEINIENSDLDSIFGN